MTQITAVYSIDILSKARIIIIIIIIIIINIIIVI